MNHKHPVEPPPRAAANPQKPGAHAGFFMSGTWQNHQNRKAMTRRTRRRHEEHEVLIPNGLSSYPPRLLQALRAPFQSFPPFACLILPSCLLRVLRVLRVRHLTLLPFTYLLSSSCSSCLLRVLRVQLLMLFAFHPYPSEPKASFSGQLRLRQSPARGSCGCGRGFLRPARIPGFRPP